MSVKNLVLTVTLFILTFAVLIGAVIAGVITEILGIVLLAIWLAALLGYFGWQFLESCDRIEKAGHGHLFSEIAAQTARFRRRARGRRW